MEISNKNHQRIIGLDMHPDIFTACALQGAQACEATVLWVHDRVELPRLEGWAKKHLRGDDIIVLEASGNSFEVVERLARLGLTAFVLESAQAGKLRENYCNDDKSSATKLARIYLTGLAKVVWSPDEKTRGRRELYYSYERAVKDSTRSKNRIRSFLSDHCVRLPKGTPLTQPKGLAVAQAAHCWDPLQWLIIENLFADLYHAEQRRKDFERHMAIEVYQDKKLRQLMRLMGIKHIIAFTLGAFIGDINRFVNAKKLVGYIGLSPRKTQSGNNKNGTTGGIGNGGKKQIRSLLIQSAQNALKHKNSPYHTWGHKLAFRKPRNVAVAAVARKIATAVWHLLKGHFTPLIEASPSMKTKIRKISTIIGKEYRASLGFNSAEAFIEHFIQNIKVYD